MAKGGIYDQVGGGFARYSVDAHWLVPHFEKMLYDNALLARAYLHAWQLTGDELFRRVCEETLDWVLREMRGPEGGFYSALDADSEGEEGKFYVWTADELRELLRRRRRPRCSRYWGVDRGPNFEGRNILHVARRRDRPRGARAGAPRRCTRCASKRVWPGPRRQAPDGLERAHDRGARRRRRGARARRLPRRRARSAPSSSLEQMRDAQGRLLRTYKDGRASLNAYLEDHAFLVEALLVAVRGDVRDALVRAPRARSPTR